MRRTTVRQTLKPVLFRNAAGEHRPDRAVHISNRQIERHLVSLLQRRLAQLDQLVIKHIRETVVLFLHTIASNLRPHIR
jgi:hypothetical protein